MFKMPDALDLIDGLQKISKSYETLSSDFSKKNGTIQIFSNRSLSILTHSVQGSQDSREVFYTKKSFIHATLQYLKEYHEDHNVKLFCKNSLRLLGIIVKFRF